MTNFEGAVRRVYRLSFLGASAILDASPATSEAVVFEHVTFALDEHTILRDLSFSSPRGRMKLLLGASGGGSSCAWEGLMRTITAMLAGSLSVGLLLTAAAASQTPEKKPPDLVIRSVAGRDLFNFYCASCHGLDGKGGGHVAAALKTRPADLTVLTERNGGTFPAAKVDETIRGETQTPDSAHGTSDMPVWGPIFRGLDKRKEVNDARIENLVKYIESIQAKAKTE